MNLWRCGCGHKMLISEMLEGVSPFDPTDHVRGCPKCKACNPEMVQECDEPGCTSAATCGSPGLAGYRWTCGRHMP